MKSVSLRSCFGGACLWLALTFTGSALAAPPVENVQCILGQPGAPNSLNCTSNDIVLSSPIVEVVEPCSYPGDTATLEVVVDITNNATSRYDVGVWVAVDGDPNGDGAESGICTVLSIPNNILNQDGVSTLGDGDACGDVFNAALDPDILDADLGTFTISCEDTDGDGLINVPLIISWNNQTGGATCTTSIGTIPNTPAKCRSNPDANLPVPVPARLIVNKTTAGADPTSFAFTLAGPTPADPAPGGWDGTDYDFNLAHGEQFDSATVFVNGGLPAGDDYSVTETAVAGWQSSGSCSSDVDGGNTDPANLDLRAGETVTCDFVNTPETGTLTVVKQTQGAAGDSFSFNGTGTIGAFQLDTSGTNPAQQQFVVAPGNYNVVETVTAGWVLSSASCTGTGTTDLAGGAINNIAVTAGGSVTCTFVNAPTGTITVNKITIGGDDTFGFISDVEAEGADDFDITTVNGSGSVGGGFEIVEGSYTITEDTLPDGWEFVEASCSDQGGDITGSVDQVARSVSFDVDNGDTVSCTFVNQALGLLSLSKITNPASAIAFSFDGDIVASIGNGGNAAVPVSAGSYSTTETVPAGWMLSSIVCDDENSTGDVGTATATWNIEAGEEVNCTFTNTQLASIRVVKALDSEVIPDGVSTAFDFTPDFDDPFTLDPVNSPSEMLFENLEPGVPYAVTETVPVAEGWTLASATCGVGETVNLGAGSITNIVPQPGQEVVCTFTNGFTPPQITLVKEVLDGEAAPEDFTLVLTGVDGTHDSGVEYVTGSPVPVSAGVAYTVTELDDVADYFQVGDVVCVDDGTLLEVASPVTLTGSQAVTCTVTNQANVVVFDILTEVCINDTPFVNYDVSTSEGPAPSVTITWIKDDGSMEVVETIVDAPPVGQLLWPGAAVDENNVPIAWPGWSCDAQGMNCTQINDGLVPTMQLLFEINPSETVIVSYPPATPACNAAPFIPGEYVPIPVNHPLAIILMTLMMLALGWHFRPAVMRRQ